MTVWTVLSFWCLVKTFKSCIGGSWLVTSIRSAIPSSLSSPGVCTGEELGAGAAEDGVYVSDGDLLQGHPSAEGHGGSAGQEIQAGRHPRHWGWGQRCQHDQGWARLRFVFEQNSWKAVTVPHCVISVPSFSCSYRRRHQRSGGHAGSPLQRLLLRPVPLPAAPPAGARSLVVPTHVQVPTIFLLQELHLHLCAFLVCLLLRLLCTGEGHVLGLCGIIWWVIHNVKKIRNLARIVHILTCSYLCCAMISN